MQEAWGNKITSMDQVDPECQANFESIVHRSLALGINHFETAKGYGCSEIQYNQALVGVLSGDNGYTRDDIILQTKLGPCADNAQFRKDLEDRFTRLSGLEYLDLFGFHGINRMEQIDWILRPGGNMEVIEEFRAAGKIRWVGFSTHGQVDVICAAINTGRFDYVNLHHHWCGSYTTSGASAEFEGTPYEGNGAAMRAATAQDMGLFCISPVDKGGRAWEPSVKLARLCEPDLSLLEFTWLWGWAAATDAAAAPLSSRVGGGGFHTMVLGAARPADFDQAVAAARLHGTQEGLAKLHAVAGRLRAAAEEALGKEWLDTWWTGLPGCFEPKSQGVHVNNIVWYHVLIHAFGMFEYTKQRYSSLIGNRKKWEDGKTWEENLAIQGWGFGPGLSVGPSGAKVLLETGALSCCPDPDKVVAILDETHAMLSGGDGAPALPAGSEAAYDMRPWPAFCERGRATQVPRASYKATLNSTL